MLAPHWWLEKIDVGFFFLFFLNLESQGRWEVSAWGHPSDSHSTRGSGTSTPVHPRQGEDCRICPLPASLLSWIHRDHSTELRGHPHHLCATTGKRRGDEVGPQADHRGPKHPMVRESHRPEMLSLPCRPARRSAWDEFKTHCREKRKKKKEKQKKDLSYIKLIFMVHKIATTKLFVRLAFALHWFKLAYRAFVD